MAVAGSRNNLARIALAERAATVEGEATHETACPPRRMCVGRVRAAGRSDRCGDVRRRVIRGSELTRGS
jgi:hypothetical protein